MAPGGLLASVYHLTRIEYGIDQPEEILFRMSRANRMKLKEFRIMNYVPRTSLRWAIESKIGGNAEI
ncbi:NADH dehydrogenase subunit J [Prunus dulcis]|uniref:NADH dehydrogenase subunit J n=1 Tax=Prunus dulcis TaxID=3755 RepID=A0A5H2XPM2_PRUDU|nr:NADH dehydrogenase subunit J [Prunus dulcis]BBN69377.1 NADH dehydrogenase subunit J [Prunus dulcis]BBN69937.1 NADH dehydrogenase subunit J [Prunus dulcis]BBN70092.1 hypothetical protein Prudu_1415S000200 [Prunus dulcis]BBN70102.1 NADH dehydrogenase subunit J [Prunus dulcis]